MILCVSEHHFPLSPASHVLVTLSALKSSAQLVLNSQNVYMRAVGFGNPPQFKDLYLPTLQRSEVQTLFLDHTYKQHFGLSQDHKPDEGVLWNPETFC